LPSALPIPRPQVLPSPSSTGARAAAEEATTEGQAMSWARCATRPALGGRSGRRGPVRLPVCVCQVGGEPCSGDVPVDELVEGQLARQGTRPPDVAGELPPQNFAPGLDGPALPRWGG